VDLFRTLLLAGFLALTCPVYATPWTNWTSATAGANGGGAANGSLGGVTVSYQGELDSFVTNGTSTIWSPNSSFIGGSVTSAPSAVGDDLRLNGSSTGINTILFGSAVVNPLIAFWSLGGPGGSASFTFLDGLTPIVQAGGPNSISGGSSITALGSVVTGVDGNGVVQFMGTFNKIEFTSTFEDFYAFTVGVSDSAVPEPALMALVAAGLAFVALRIKRGSQRSRDYRHARACATQRD